MTTANCSEAVALKLDAALSAWEPHAAILDPAASVALARHTLIDVTRPGTVRSTAREPDEGSIRRAGDRGRSQASAARVQGRRGVERETSWSILRLSLKINGLADIVQFE